MKNSLHWLLPWVFFLATGALASTPDFKAFRRDYLLELASARNAADTASTFADRSRIEYYLGRLSGTKEERRNWFEQGVRDALQAQALERSNPAALLWWTANEGELAQMSGVFAALGAVSKIEGVLLKLKQSRPDYFFGAADRALGYLYSVAPSIISVGSKTKALSCFEEALRLAPGFPGNQVLLAEFLAGHDRPEDAKNLAKKALMVLSSDDRMLSPVDRIDWKARAEKVLASN